MKKVLTFLWILFLCVKFLCAQDTAVHITSLPLLNLYEVDKGVYRSEQPDNKSFIALDSFGVQEVLNLRNYHNDNKEASNTKIVLYRVEMDAHRIKDEEVVAALKIIQNRKGAILFHCKHGSDRTGLICAMYRIVFQQWSKQDAIAELKTPKYGYHKIFSNIPKYIENVDIEKIKEQLAITE